MFVKSIYEKVLVHKIKKINDYLESIKFKNPRINEMYAYSIASGKRFRPLLTMIACEVVGGKSSKIIPVACSIELLHKASLIHDDLIDHDDYRRGKKTFYHKYGKEKAVIMGDLLIAVGFENIIRRKRFLKDPDMKKRYQDYLEKLITTFRHLALGELEEEVISDRDTVMEEEIESVLYQKTAVLIETCFTLGAVLGDGTQKEIDALSRFGRYIGLAFQTINDINNIDGIDSNSKKKLGSDLMRRKKNLTIVHTLKNGTEKDRKAVNRILGKKKISGKDVERLCDIILENKSIDYAREKVKGYLWKAKESLSQIKNSFTKRILLGIIDEANNKWFWTS